MLSRTPPPFALSAAGASASTGTIVFSNSNGVTFGQNGNTITASVAAGGGGGSVNFSAGTTSNNLASVVFSNSNLVSFGLNGSTITGSIPSSFAGSGFTTTTSNGAVIAGTNDSNGLKLGVPSFLTTAMASNAATISNVNVSAGTTSQNLSKFVFSNSNLVSFGLNGSTITGSIPSSFAGSGFTTTTVAGAVVAGTNDSSGLKLAVPSYLTTAMASNAATISNVNVSAGTTSTNASAFTFSNANGVTFGLGTGASAGVVTASVAAGGGGSVNISAGTTSQNLTNFVFSNSNNVSFGLNGSTITASIVPGGGSPFLAGISGGNTSGNTGTVSSQLVMAGGNNVTLSGSTVAGNMTVTVSGPNMFSGGISTIGNTSGTTALVSNQLVLAGGNNITLSGSSAAGGMTVTISGAAAGGAQTAISGIVASNTTFTSGTVSFSGNNITVSSSANGASQYVILSANAQTNQSMGIYAASQSTAQSSSSTIDARSLSIAGMGGVSVGMSAGSLVISGATGGGGAFSAGMSTDGNTSGTSGLVGSQIQFVGSAGIGLSQSVNGNSATLSVLPAFTVQNYAPFVAVSFATGTMGNGPIQLYPVPVPFCVTGTVINHLISGSVSTSSNSSMAGTVSVAAALYTRNGSTLSMASSGSTAFQFTNTSNNSTSVLNGARQVGVPMDFFMTPGEYYVALMSSTASANANWFTASNIFAANGVNLSGGQFLAAPSNSSHQLYPGVGQFSTAAWAVPASIAFSQITGGGATNINRAPIVQFNNVTF